MKPNGNIYWQPFLGFVLILGAAALRLASFPASNFDMETYNLVWYRALAENGILKTLGTNFTNYTPIYSYLLSLAVLTRPFLQPLYALKLIPTIFDIFAAAYVGRIVRLKYEQGHLPFLASAVYFAAPTILLNSSYWGQADAIYAFFLILSLYYLLRSRSIAGMIAFGLAFSVKAQAVFFAPFLAILFFQKKLKGWHFFIVPAVYLVTVLPVVLLGRPFTSAISTYLEQGASYNVLAANSPNFYIFFLKGLYNPLAGIGILAAVILLGVWIRSSVRLEAQGMDAMILFASISLVLSPFLLPKMHDRYFYASDVFTIILAFLQPSLWFIAVLTQLSSALAYFVFLLKGPFWFTAAGAVINSFVVAILLKRQFRPVETADQKRSVMPFVVAAAASMVLAGIGVKLLLSPLFMRLEYTLPHVPESALSQRERYEIGSLVMEHIDAKNAVNFLAKTKLENGKPAFSREERVVLEKWNQKIVAGVDLWRVSILSLHLLLLTTWALAPRMQILQGMQYAGWLSVSLAVLAGIATILFFVISPPVYDGILNEVIPAVLWRDYLLLACFIWAGLGWLLAMASNLSIKQMQQGAK